MCFVSISIPLCLCSHFYGDRSTSVTFKILTVLPTTVRTNEMSQESHSDLLGNAEANGFRLMWCTIYIYIAWYSNGSGAFRWYLHLYWSNGNVKRPSNILLLLYSKCYQSFEWVKCINSLHRDHCICFKVQVYLHVHSHMYDVDGWDDPTRWHFII